MFSSKKDDWTTPPDFFKQLDNEFHFTLDAASSEENHLCKNYFTIETDGLSQDWGGHKVFCNPPYGRQIGKWVQKAWEEAKKPNTTIVMLLPARTDTKWFHSYIYHQAKIRFIKGRLKFGGSQNSAPFPSMVVIWDYYRGF